MALKGFYTDHVALGLPPNHRFPAAKYGMLRQAIAANLPQVQLCEAPGATDAQLALAHTPEYVQAIAGGTADAAQMREIGFPWSAGMVERSRRSVGATLAACRAALADGVAGNLAGGTHHASAGRGSGFCVFNDAAVAVRQLQLELGALPVAIVDLDVHQGNGSAEIFAGDASVFTLSLHGAKNFPFRKVASCLDVDLPDGCTDMPYLEALYAALRVLEQQFSSQLVIYLAGSDPHEDDRLGRLKLTAQGLRKRDETVFAWALQRRIPLAFAMAGGYSQAIETTVELQLATWQAACASWAAWSAQKQ